MDFRTILDWIKLSPKYLLPIVIVSGFLIFSNGNILNIFGLFIIVNQYRGWIGIIFLVTIALLLSDVALRMVQWLQNKRKLNEKFKDLTSRLYKLTPYEKNIILGFTENNTRTQYLSIEDGTIQELSNFEIIYRSSNFGRSTNRWSFNIQPWAWDFIRKNKDKIFSKEDIETYYRNK